jgi:HYR domain
MFASSKSSTAPPTLTVPESFTVEAKGPTGALVRFTVRATDYEGTPLVVSCAPRSGVVFPLGQSTVKCSTTDSIGQRTTRSFTVTVVDTKPPAVTTPTELVIDAVSPSGAVVEFTPTVTDAVTRDIAAVCTPASGSTFAIGDTTVTCRATDSSGNTGEASFSVHVKGADEQLADVQTYLDSLGSKRTSPPGSRSTSPMLASNSSPAALTRLAVCSRSSVTGRRRSRARA